MGGWLRWAGVALAAAILLLQARAPSARRWWIGVGASPLPPQVSTPPPRPEDTRFYLEMTPDDVARGVWGLTRASLPAGVPPPPRVSAAQAEALAPLLEEAERLKAAQGRLRQAKRAAQQTALTQALPTAARLRAAGIPAERVSVR